MEKNNYNYNLNLNFLINKIIFKKPVIILKYLFFKLNE